MTDEDLVTIASYGNPHEASIAKGALEAENVRSFLLGAEIANTLSYVGTALGGVKLQVAQGDAERASEILAAIGAPDILPLAGAWKCPNCGAEIDAGFDVCWSCGRVADQDITTIQPDQAAETTDEPIAERSVHECRQPDGRLASSADATVARAWRAAVIGTVIFPFLIYSLFLIVSLSHDELSPSATRKFYRTFAIIVLMFVGFWSLFRIFG